MSALDRVEQSLNFTRVAGVVRGALFDRLDGVDDRAVIAIAKVQADRLERIFRQLLGQVHGDLTGIGYFFLSRFADQQV